VYNLKITGLTTQRDMSLLVKTLLKIPGLKPDHVSSGLKIPPFNVLSTEKEEEVQKLKSVLEKLGATCTIENTKAYVKEKNNKTTGSMDAYPKHRHHRKFRLNFWVAVFSIIGIFVIITSFDFSCESKQNRQSPHERRVVQTVGIPDTGISSSDLKSQMKNNSPAATNIAKINSELKKNPYNAEAWKILAANLEKQGDTASAQRAKYSYEQALKVQLVLASLAKAFGTKVRVEVTEDAVYYRTTYDFTDNEFRAEAEKLMDSLSVKFPGKNLIIENYTSGNRIQNIQLKSKN